MAATTVVGHDHRLSTGLTELHSSAADPAFEAVMSTNLAPPCPEIQVRLRCAKVRNVGVVGRIQGLAAIDRVSVTVGYECISLKVVDAMSILRVGSSKQFADGWDAAFGSGNKSTKKTAAKKGTKKSTAKTAAAAKKKSAAKKATKKKTSKKAAKKASKKG